MRRAQWQQRLAAAVAPLVVVAGCAKTPPRETPVTPAERVAPVSDRPQVDSATSGRYRVQATDDKMRVYFNDQAGAADTLIRCLPVASASVASAERDAQQALVAREDEATRLWLDCKSRVVAGQFANVLTEHDAWLETAQRLEERLERDPDHLGVLRDLIVAYLHVLSFEASTPLGSNLCLLTGRRISEFETRAAPLDPPDRELVDEGRALLFHAMKLYPCVAELLRDSRLAARGQGLRHTLAALGQARFAELDRGTVGPLALRTFRTLGNAPDPGLLWEELHFVLSGHEPAVPESTVAYVLVREGSGEERSGEHARYYLYFRSLNRSQLVAAFGATRPTAAALRRWVEDAARQGLAETTAEAKP